jgi:hypothetical protein
MTRVLIRDLEPGRTYHVQARLNSGDQVSQWSQLFDLATTSDILPPAAPTGLTWSVVGTAFKAAWTGPVLNQDGSPMNDFKDFQVKVYSPADTGTVITYYTTSARFDFSFEANLNSFGVPRANVNIEVRARDNTGNLSNAATASASNPVPSNVTGLTAAGISDAVSLRWDSVTDDDLKCYKVYQGTSSGSATNLVYTGLATSFVYDTILTSTQYFKVYAVDVFNTLSAAAATANAVPRSTLSVDATPPATPTGVTVASSLDSSDPSGSRSYVDVSWSAVADTDLQNYSVRFSASSSGPWQYINVPEGVVTARINNLRPATSYYVAVAAVDFSGNSSSYANAGTFPITTSADTTAPSQPSTPTIAANAMQVQISHNGTKSGGGSMESDVDRYEVYASTTSGFTASSSNMIGSIKNGVVIIGSFPIPASASSGTTQTWYARVIAVDNAGNKSIASFQSSASVPLISTANIGDATITNAKVSDLAADKITAGTGIINNLLIKSTLTIDTAGALQSGNFNDTTKVGYQLANTTLKLYDGTVYARALVLKNGENLLPIQYADFEWSPSWYASNPLVVSHDGGTETYALVTATTTAAKYGAQCVSITRTASAGTYSRLIFTTSSTTNYNVTLEANTDYIVSGWFKSLTGDGDKTITMNLRSSSNNINGTSQVLTSDSVWRRMSWVLTTDANTIFTVDVKTFTAGTLFVDGIQIEQKRTAEATPSQWRPPSATTLDGGAITTGEIRSTASANGLSGQPAWSINTQGNAQFGDAAIRGRLVVGDIANPSADGANSKIISSNYVANTSGWTIRNDGYAEFNNVLVRGTYQGSNLFLNTSGSFFYSGTPALNNLIMSIATSSGTDSYGNSYPAGPAIKNSGYFSVYNSSGVLVNTIGGPLGAISQISGSLTVQLVGGKLQWNASGPGDSSTISSDGLGTVIVHSGYPGGGGANLSSEFKIIDGDSTLGQDNQPRFVLVESTGVYRANGMISGAMLKADLTGINAENWQTPSYSASWAGSTTFNGTTGWQSLQYRLDAQDNLHLVGCFKASAGAGTTVFNLPSKFRPKQQEPAICHRNNAGAFSVFTLAIASSGNINILAGANGGVATSSEYLVNAVIPLGNIT